ncbi:MAG: hypothetical protein BWX89_01590 [candidate division TA06 bacterium ADurb.Bin131]|uniref:Secreted protein n=1 Tax=candidate division TA06 bacterium ADurb.Bin131 TaxID=1852827 RepID=A0A1V6C4U8_UNCT6|nr:MAG: hypothetical protein BWX89_01590 [candidate division TA06 bacterium ADurb.Bin131]
MSLTIFLIIISCCASFHPKYALCGCIILNNFATTVHTPVKCPGRIAPSSFSEMSATEMVVRCFSEYISSTDGAKTTSTFVSLSIEISLSISLGYL